MEKVLFVTVDGASANLGAVKGMKAYFTEAVPHVVCIHCAVHRLQLALAAAMREIPMVQRAISTMHNTAKFIWPRAAKFASFAEKNKSIIDLYEEIRRIAKDVPTRWLSQDNCFTSLMDQLGTVIGFLEYYTTDLDERPMAIALLHDLKNPYFLWSCCFVADAIHTGAVASGELQGRDIGLAGAEHIIEELIMSIESALDNDPRKNCGKFQAWLMGCFQDHVEQLPPLMPGARGLEVRRMAICKRAKDGTFVRVQFRTTDLRPEEIVIINDLRIQLKDSMVKHINGRLGEDSNHKIVKSLKVFSGSYKETLIRIKAENGDFGLSGYSDIESLVEHYDIGSYAASTNKAVIMSGMKQQFNLYRKRLSESKLALTTSKAVWDWFMVWGKNSSLKPLVKIACVAMATTVEAESTFSSQVSIDSTLRFLSKFALINFNFGTLIH